MESHVPPSRRPDVVIDRTPGLVAIVNGAEIPIGDYALSTDEYGQPVLSLVLMPGWLSVGKPPVSLRESAQPAVSSWGDGKQPDPRGSIPGWQPESLGEQVAGHAEQVALRTWEPSNGQGRTPSFARLLNGGQAATA
jgi:hypothetical protein